MTSFDDDDPGHGSPEPMWRRYLRMIRSDAAGDLDDELRDHIESSVDRLVAGGMSRDAARAEALRRFGDVEHVRTEVNRLNALERTRMNRMAALETFFFDLRYAVRGLGRSAAFTAVATISIALGVAANASVFSVVNAILLRPIPGAHAARLNRVYVNQHSPFDWHDLAWLRDNVDVFSSVIGERYGAMAFRASSRDEAERIHASYVTRGFFPTLGVRMSAGRAFDVDETHPEQAAVAVLSHAFWERRFGGDSSVIGRHVVVGDQDLLVTGVADADFRSSEMGWSPDVFLPLAMAPAITGHPLGDFGGSFYTIAQRMDGVSESQADAALRVAMRQLAQSDSARYDGRSMRLGDIRGVTAEVRAGVTAGSVFLMAMVAMVLLTACANVANLLLGRAAARRTEMGVRLAIGASRARLVRQLLTESFLLAVIGTLLGFAIAWVITRLLPAALPAEAGIDPAYFAPDGRVLAFTLVLCAATTLLFGMAPALRAASPNLVGMLKGNGTPDGQRGRRGRLVTVQTAMCVLLLCVALLFLRGLASARNVDPGFRAQGVVDVDVDFDLLPTGPDRSRLFTAVLENAARLPGVQSASLAAVVPLAGSNMETTVTPEGMTPATRADRPHVYFNIVSPGFFATLQTPILRGRDFLASDRDGAERVAVVNESAARRLWPDGDALGQRVHWGDETGPLVTIVAVVRDANYVMPGEFPKTTVYFPFAQAPRGEMTLQLRTTADVRTMRRAVWDMLHAIAPELPPPPVVAMTDDMSITLLPVRAGFVLLGAFGLLALVLASAGIYGVAAYSVASRMREIGVRAALGATRGRIVGMVLLENGRRVAAGAAVGLVLAVAVGAGLSRILYGVRALDAAVVLSVAAIMSAVALLATLAPARRAARVDPVLAMRQE